VIPIAARSRRRCGIVPLTRVGRGFPQPEEFVHHVLCFNAAKILEVISRRQGG